MWPAHTSWEQILIKICLLAQFIAWKITAMGSVSWELMNSLDKGSEKGFCDDGVFFRVFKAGFTMFTMHLVLKILARFFSVWLSYRQPISHITGTYNVTLRNGEKDDKRITRSFVLILLLFDVLMLLACSVLCSFYMCSLSRGKLNK